MPSSLTPIDFSSFPRLDTTDADHYFEKVCKDNFDFQKTQNPVFRSFLTHLGRLDFSHYDSVPLLPIEAFRDAKIMTSDPEDYELFFQSSGTTGMKRNRHFIYDASLYKNSLTYGFRRFYPLDDLVILAYTPGYAENPHSSLIWMLQALMREDSSGVSCFLPLEKAIPQELLTKIASSGKKLMIFGAAFGLLDIIERYPIRLPSQSFIMETGGMKTHRREVSREALHQKLSDGFGLPTSRIHSEYGMTEMLSQAYCRDGVWFEPVPWLRVSIRNPENPLENVPDGEAGLLGIIDLANRYSCSFLLTQDIGIRREDGKFQVLGRYKNANLRGCNFLIDHD